MGVECVYLCRPVFHVRACVRRNRGTLPTDLTELGAPWAAPACPDFDLYRNWFPWLGRCLHPGQPGLDLPWRKTRPICSGSNPGVRRVRGLPCSLWV